MSAPATPGGFSTERTVLGRRVMLWRPTRGSSRWTARLEDGSEIGFVTPPPFMGDAGWQATASTGNGRNRGEHETLAEAVEALICPQGFADDGAPRARYMDDACGSCGASRREHSLPRPSREELAR